MRMIFFVKNPQQKFISQASAHHKQSAHSQEAFSLRLCGGPSGGLSELKMLSPDLLWL